MNLWLQDQKNLQTQATHHDHHFFHQNPIHHEHLQTICQMTNMATPVTIGYKKLLIFNFWDCHKKQQNVMWNMTVVKTPFLPTFQRVLHQHQLFLHDYQPRRIYISHLYQQ